MVGGNEEWRGGRQGGRDGRIEGGRQEIKLGCCGAISSFWTRNATPNIIVSRYGSLYSRHVGSSHVPKSRRHKTHAICCYNCIRPFSFGACGTWIAVVTTFILLGEPYDSRRIRCRGLRFWRSLPHSPHPDAAIDDCVQVIFCFLGK